MKVAVLQFAPVFGERDENLGRMEEALQGCHADLIVLPELATTGYQFRSRQELARLAEPLDGESVQYFQALADRMETKFVLGMAEAAGDEVYNSALVIDASGVMGHYRKVHLFGREKELFTPGDMGFPVFPLTIRAEQVNLGLMVCFDWCFPEAARSLAVGGADLIAHPANLVLTFCQDALVTRAIENRVYIAMANRVGVDERREGERLVFTGQSRIVAPDGRVLEEGPADGRACLLADLDLGLSRKKMITARNHVIEDRRLDQYRHI